MRQNRVKRIMREGGIAFSTYTGGIADPAIVEMIGLAGFDAVFVDMEHTTFDLQTVSNMLRAAELVGITSMVRVPDSNPKFILRLLDAGAQGIYVPHINNAAAARAAVEAVRYAPLGERGMAGASRAANYGLTPLAEHMRTSNEEIVLAVMVEDLSALDEIDAIASTQGVDLVAVGPSDLSSALGVAGHPDHPKLVQTMDRVVAAVKRAGCKLAFPLDHPAMPRGVVHLREMNVGYTNCGPSPEVRLMRSMTEQVRRLRAS